MAHDGALVTDDPVIEQVITTRCTTCGSHVGVGATLPSPTVTEQALLELRLLEHKLTHRLPDPEPPKKRRRRAEQPAFDEVAAHVDETAQPLPHDLTFIASAEFDAPKWKTTADDPEPPPVVDLDERAERLRQARDRAAARRQTRKLCEQETEE